MRCRLTPFAFVFLAGSVLVAAADPAAAQGWGTAQGQIVFAGARVPERNPVEVTNQKEHCLAKGKILDERWVVDPTTKGVRDVFVWLTPADGKALPVHPALAEAKPKAVAMDQPCCKFEPHALALRRGQTLVVKNSAPVNHNVMWAGGKLNRGDNIYLPPGAHKEIGDLVPSNVPVLIKCNIHPWMHAVVRVFDHPYFAVTDEKGAFTIPKAPAGRYRLVIWHDGLGWGPTGKAEDRVGLPITIQADGTTEAGKIEIKPAP